MLGDSAADAFAPKPEATGLEFPSHRANNVRFAVTRFFADFIKCGAIFPSHTNDSGDLGYGIWHRSHGDKFGAARVK